MSIALKAKRAVAALSAGLIGFSSLFIAAPALADTFLDVTPDMWSYGYIEQGVDSGYIDSGVNYRPFDNMNRAEFTKILAIASDSMAGYQAPATATFDDVAKGEWYFDYVESMAQLGVITGDTDAQGNPEGTFRPGDDILRAEAVKVINLALGVPTDLDPANQFSDVVAGSWYETHVVSAYNQSVVDGYKDAQGNLIGTFGPGDTVTREQVAKMAVTGQNPVERPGTDPNPNPNPNPVDCDLEPDHEDCVEPPVTSSDGDLEVSLSANNPAEVNIPKNANNVEVLAFDLTAVGDDVMPSKITIKRSGPGETEDISGAYLYEGNTRLTSEKTFSSDDNMATFNLKNYTVDKGDTVTLRLVINLSDTAATNSQHAFSIEAAEDVMHNGVDTLGDFPIQGETFEVGSVTVSDVTITKGGSISKVQLGAKNEEVGNFKLTAGVNDVALHTLALNQGGSLSSEDMSDCKLMRSDEELAMTEAFVGDMILFDLSENPYILEQGQSRNFEVHCDIIGGKANETAILFLDLDTDLSAMDVQYGFGANVVNNLTQGLANTVIVEGGDVIVVDNGPASTDIAQSSTNNELLNFAITADRELVVRDTFLQIDLQNPGANGPSLPANFAGNVVLGGGVNDDTSEFCLGSNTLTGTLTAGDTLALTAASGTVNVMVSSVSAANAACGNLGDGDAINETLITTPQAAGDTVSAAGTSEINPYTLVKNVKLVDLDTDDTLVDPQNNSTTNSTLVDANGVDNGGTPPHSYYRVHPQDYDLEAGVTRNLSVQADLDSNMPAGYQIRARVQYAAAGADDSYIKDLEANQFVPASDVIGAGTSSLAGNFMFTAENTLAVAKSSQPTSKSYVVGAKMVPSLGVSMTAGDAGAIQLNDLKVRVYGCNNTDDGGVLDDANTAGIQCWDDLNDAPDWESSLGNIAANTLVNTVKLYDGDDVVGPANGVTLDLVNLGGGNGYDAGTDYYVADFTDLGLIIPEGDSVNLVAKADLQNTPTGTNHIAMDILPSADVDAEDVNDQNTVSASGDALNAADIKNPLITITEGGSLTATSEGNPSADILLSGADMQLVSKYKFSAVNEDYKVDQFTILNDLVGDFNAASGTVAVDTVTVKFPDSNNDIQTVTKSLLGSGAVTFSGLDFYVDSGVPEFLEIYATLSSADGLPEVSGAKIRLGLQNIGNTSNTFTAIGQSSNKSDYFVDNDEITNSAAVNNFVVRESVPVFSQNSTPSKLSPGPTELFDFDVTVDGAGSVDMPRMVFDVVLNDADSGVVGDLALSNFKLTRDGVLVDAANVNIVDAATDASLENTTITTGNTATKIFQVIVTLNTSEPVVGSASFRLDATAAAVEAGDSITVLLSDDDEALEASGMTLGGNTNPNTGRLVDDTANHGIFTDAAGYTNDLDGDANVTIGSADIIWSDQTAEPHVFSSVIDGSSYDYTNGFRLRVNALDQVVIEE